MEKITFTKHITHGGWSGGWLFHYLGITFVAWRNEAGFVGRQWELQYPNGAIIQDMLASRKEATELAHAIATGTQWR